MSAKGDTMSAIKSQKRLMTAEEFWEMPEKPGVRYELVEGEPIEVSPAARVHSKIVGALYRLLYAFVSSRSLGEVHGDGLGYIVQHDPDTVRVPDVSFISQAHLPEDDASDGFIPFPPDLAVEIVSPSDRAQEVHDNVHQYLEAGTQVVWVVWPQRRSVTVHLPTAEAREFGSEEELSGGDVLPGFSVRVAELFNTAG